MKVTSILQKLFASIINVGLILIVSSFLIFLIGFNIKWKIVTIILFLIYELVFLFTKSKRDVGMMIIGSSWQILPSNAQYVLYNLLYTLSFSTLLFHIKFLGDLLLINLLFIQLPFVIFTKTTFHGYLANMKTIKTMRS